MSKILHILLTIHTYSLQYVKPILTPLLHLFGIFLHEAMHPVIGDWLQEEFASLKKAFTSWKKDGGLWET